MPTALGTLSSSSLYLRFTGPQNKVQDKQGQGPCKKVSQFLPLFTQVYVSVDPFLVSRTKAMKHLFLTEWGFSTVWWAFILLYKSTRRQGLHSPCPYKVCVIQVCVWGEKHVGQGRRVIDIKITNYNCDNYTAASDTVHITFDPT